MQQVCTYLQAFSHYKSQYWHNNVFLRECPSLTPLFEGNSFTQGHELMSLKTRVLGATQWKCRDPILRRFDTDKECDRQTDGQTDGRLDDGYDARCILLSRVKSATVD